jgi:hypothetical protein
MAMIFARALLGQELILVGTIALAIGLVITYLRWRGQLDLLRRAWPAALLWAIFGTLDALVTIVGTWGAPWREANPTLRAMLTWDGWVGQLIYTFVWVLFWAAIVIGLEELRRRLGGVWEYPLGAVQLLILYALALGHLYGYLSWTPYIHAPLLVFLYERAPWLFDGSPLGVFSNLSLILGAVLTALQLAIAALLHSRRGRTPIASPALAPRPRQITKR